MPNEPVIKAVNDSWVWTDRLMWSMVTMFVLGSMARTLVSETPFDLRKFVGELIFSALGAVSLYSMGLMQGMNEVQIVCFGASASLGGVRLIEWGVKISSAIRRNGSLND